MAFNIQRTPKAYSITVTGGTTYTSPGNSVTWPGQQLCFCQISNLSNGTVNVRLNDDSNCVFQIQGNVTQVFNPGDVDITKVAFDNSASGASAVNVQMIVGIMAA